MILMGLYSIYKTKSTLLFEGTVISHKKRQIGDSADYI